MSHQPDERDLFRRLGDDAQRADLAGPEELRRTSDRRTAARAALGGVAVVVAVGGVIIGGSALNGTAAPDIVDTPSPTVTTSDATPSPSESATTPTPTPTETTQVAASAIPEEAWLDKSDLGQGISHRGRFEPPSLCGQPLVARSLVDSGVAIVDGTRDGTYQEAGDAGVPEGTTRQTIMLMSSRRAADQLMDDIQGRVAACPEETTLDDPSQRTYALADPGLPISSARPDRHLLIDVSTSYEMYWEIAPEGVDRFDTFISVVQVRDAVSILEVRGWEASDTTLEEVHRLAAPAMVRLLDWRS